MSATRTILLGTALGLAVGAAALAQDAASSSPTELGTDMVPSEQTGEAFEIPLPGSMGIDLGTTAEVTVETPFPEGEELVAAADELIGTRVYDVNQEWIGEVSELVPADGSAEPRVVIDIGGFLGFGETPVEVDADEITVAWTEDGDIDHAMVALTEAQLELLARSES